MGRWVRRSGLIILALGLASAGAAAAATKSPAAPSAPAPPTRPSQPFSGETVSPLNPPPPPGLPKAPYMMQCFLDRDMVVNEGLAAAPSFKDGQWQARSWSPDPARNGLNITIQQGANATCIVRQNAR